MNNFLRTLLIAILIAAICGLCVRLLPAQNQEPIFREYSISERDGHMRFSRVIDTQLKNVCYWRYDSGIFCLPLR